MAEPIAEVFVIRCEGLKDKVYLDGELADRMLDDQRSAGWDVTLERLPIATPEMVDVIEAAQALDRAATTEHLRPEDLAKRYRDLHVALRSLDAARAARGEHE